MISFSINNEFLDMPADPSVDLQRQSPLFQFEGFVQEDYTLPIRFPNTPKNKRIFDFPHIIENASRLRPKWDAVLYYNGVPRLKGEIRAKSPINKDFITANFVAGLSLIGQDVKERKLSEIIDETETIHTLTVTKAIRLQFISATSPRCAIIINGNEFVGTDLANLITVINADPDVTVTASSVSDELILTADTAGEFFPFHIEIPTDAIFLVPPINAVAAWQDTYYTTYNDYLLGFFGAGRLTEKIRYGMYGNFAEWKEAENPIKRWPVANFYFGGNLEKNQIRSDLSRRAVVDNSGSLAPMLTVKALLEFIETYYSITIDFAALNEDDVLFHTFTIDRQTTILNGSKLILFESAFNLNQLVPDITVNEFIKALQVGFNASATFDPDSRVLTIAHRQPLITERDYIDITLQVSEPSDIQIAPKSGVRFALRADDKDVVDSLTFFPSDFLVEDAERVVQAGFGAPGMRNHTNQFDFPQGTATSTVLVNLPFETKFPLKFARYIDDVNHPYLDSQFFLWAGVNGLIETYWKDSIFLENTPRTIKNTWLMPRNDIFETRWGQRWRIDRNDYFLQNFSVSLKNNKVSASDCLFVRLDSFKDGEPPENTLFWRVLPSSLRCQKDANNQNTGIAIYDLLEQYDDITDQSTGLTKLNVVSDPDYVAPDVVASSFCPLSDNTYQIGNIYVTMSPDLDINSPRISFNGVEYLLRRGRSNSFPYPYVMTATTQVGVVITNNPNNQVQNWRVQLFRGVTKVFDQSRIVGPNNQVNTDFGVFSTKAARTITLGDLLFDETQYHRLIITREDI